MDHMTSTNGINHDGGQSAESAAAIVADAMRDLRGATSHGEELPQAGTIEIVAAWLGGAAGRLNQTLQQLAARTHELATDPTLYRDDDVADTELATVTARQAADHLVFAQESAVALQEALAAANQSLMRLGHRPTKES